MVATQTVPQSLFVGNSVTPIESKLGTVTLFGYGVRVRIERGHLILEDGIGPERRKGRFARVGHNLRRLVVVGSDGMVSLSALRWLADQDASFVMLDRSGSVLLTTGPVRPSDARLRRAQALSRESGVGMHIARELVTRKIQGQEHVIRNKFCNSAAPDLIAATRIDTRNANSIDALRQIEARAANSYWSAWRELAIRFPQRDMPRVPEHWRRFGFRKSPLTGSPRLAINPPNAMLNYLYALLESECSLALAALGLDPGLGVFHLDSPSRHSLACDLMEAIRPQVDAYVLDWIRGQLLSREWFFEQRDGNCRLMGPFAGQLAETIQTWATAVAPVAEWVSKTFWSALPKPSRPILNSTRLTQNHRRISKGGGASISEPIAPKPPHVCRNCGKPLKRSDNRACGACAIVESRENMLDAAKLGRIITHLPKAQALRAATQRKHAADRRTWDPLGVPDWLTARFYRDEIMPNLASLTVPTICLAIGVSEPYASDIRRGRRVPHLRHWQALARIAGFSRDGTNVRTDEPR